MAGIRRNKFEDMAAAVAAGSTVRDAAQAVGWSERHGYRQSAMPAFDERVKAIRSAMVATAIAKLTAGMSDAADRLAELRKSESQGVALRACESTLELAVKLQSTGDLLGRVAELEKRVNAKHHRPPGPDRIPFALRNDTGH